MKLSSIKNAMVSGKTVFLRADLDVPLTKLETRNSKLETKIEDDTRLVAALPTIEYLLRNGAKVIVAGHLGRPKIVNQELSLRPELRPRGIKNHELSLRPVAQWLAKRFHNSSFMIHDSKLGEFDGWRINDDIFLLENLRFYKGEEENDKEFSKKLASLADLYVNDAFAMSHRNHASIVGITNFLPHFAGFHLEKEIDVLGKVMDNPRRPLVVIVGGKKIETKLPLVEKMHKIADYVLVGGKIAKEVETLFKIKNNHTEEKHAVLVIGELNKNKTDISNKSVKEFLEIIKNAGTVVWNGPVGMIKLKVKNQKSKVDTEKGTRELAEGIVKSKVYAVVGGGDTVEFLRRIKLIDKFSFASTGGGAMLAYLSGEKLPGLVALAKT